MNTDLTSTLEDKKGIIFDLFHTLTSLESTWSKRPTTSEMLGVSTDDWNEQLLECSRDRLVGKLNDPYQIIRSMAHAIDPSLPEALIIRATENRIHLFTDALINIPPTNIELLRTLRNRGLKLALISNADVIEAQAWDKSPIADLFHVTLFSCHVGYAKPEPEIYNLCLSKLDLCAEACIFVGDGGSNELRGAKECGITAVMITEIIQDLWPDKIEERKAQADFVIEELSELLAVKDVLNSK